jgi:hypothetical protein
MLFRKKCGRAILDICTVHTYLYIYRVASAAILRMYWSSRIWDLTLRQSSGTRFCRGSTDIVVVKWPKWLISHLVYVVFSQSGIIGVLIPSIIAWQSTFFATHPSLFWANFDPQPFLWEIPGFNWFMRKK